MAQLLNDDELEQVDGGKRIARTRTVSELQGSGWKCSCGRENSFDTKECLCGRKNPNMQQA